MKINKKYYLSALVSLISVTSCNKYLDETPDNRTEINSVEKVAQLVATAYPTADYLYFTESASDNAEDKGNGVGGLSDVLTRPYFWQDVIGTNTGTPASYWNGCYEAIAAANQALASIEQYRIGAEVNPYKGEALICRAYAHFMLVTFFSKAYQIGGANSSPGVPYVTEPETEVIKHYERGTVASTYEKIEKDLQDGLKLINASAYQVPKYHFTPAAANAFAARFYLFKGEWQKVVDFASGTVSGGDFTGNIRPINTTLNALGAEEFKAAFTRSDQKSNLLLANQYSSYQREANTPRYGYGQKLVTMFSKDYNYTKSKDMANKILFYGVPNYTTYKYNEYFFRTSPNASTGFPYIMSILFSTDEALLNRAEAYTELGQYDNAMRDMATMYSNLLPNYNPQNDAPTLQKIKDYYQINDDKQVLIQFILDTKKAQFLQEGMRWMDILRHRITVRHNVYNEKGAESFIELTPDDNRRLFQIPQETKLSGIELNPR
ncbi:RagB/SusD family nutrient uptake outer membrane protein [Mucilaginibacter sp. Bleaf8]|uniref:RagB/SusD family nutrient uptake outer membrane protein n=1 Tax=Mucilaginibacter sp. Bleaf8 TaxID=2834430 RepID=UPI001BCE7D75|nr:RagB/SusD family nutrient uptake outer membrane protein [Mucilaginibacter sp. Bleaf8]MBS7565728.1 RagB/SusD family nutrient uptake outer membrane protein [Mucilaginibacter sp. Bleaf8]